MQISYSEAMEVHFAPELEANSHNPRLSRAEILTSWYRKS